MSYSVFCLEIDAFGIFVLILMLSNVAHRQQGGKTLDQKCFNALLLLNTVILVFDAASWMLNGQILFSSPAFSIALENIVTYGYMLLHMPFFLTWLIYCEYKLYGSRERIRRRLPFYAIPTVIVTLLLLINPFTEWVFYIDAQNIYHRAPLMPLMVILAASYGFIAMVVTAIRLSHSRRRDITKHRYIFCFPIIPILAIVIQMLCYGLPLLWASTALALLMVFIKIQNSQIRNDALTGVYNRRYMEQYLAAAVSAHQAEEVLFAIMLDIDRFKSINDRFGHAVGDDALVQTVAILRECCDDNDCIARLGGDEFLLVGNRSLLIEVDSLTDRITRAAEYFNQTKKAPYSLTFSMGYAICGEDGTNSADRRMYQIKAAHHLAYREEESDGASTEVSSC